MPLVAKTLRLSRLTKKGTTLELLLLSMLLLYPFAGTSDNRHKEGRNSPRQGTGLKPQNSLTN